jgi:hypothetical protein
LGSSKLIEKHKCIIQSVRIIKAWQHVSPEVIVKVFKKCCISNAMDDTDNDILWNGSEEDGNIKELV